MAMSTKLSTEEQVTAYFKNLNHPLLNVIEALRKIIVAADNQIGEQIKWSSPAYYYTGEMKPFDPKEYRRDIVVFNLYKKDIVLLVFPTGATVDDKTGLLEGKFADQRKIVKFAALAEVKNKEKDLQTVIRSWLAIADK